MRPRSIAVFYGVEDGLLSLLSYAAPIRLHLAVCQVGSLDELDTTLTMLNSYPASVQAVCFVQGGSPENVLYAATSTRRAGRPTLIVDPEERLRGYAVPESATYVGSAACSALILERMRENAIRKRGPKLRGIARVLTSQIALGS